MGVVEAVGSQVQTVAGYAPWGPAEEKEEDTEMMERLLQQLEEDGHLS